MQAIIELTLERPFELRMVKIAGMQLEVISVHRNRRIFELNDYFNSFAFGACAEIEQGMFIQAELIQNALQAVVICGLMHNQDFRTARHQRQEKSRVGQAPWLFCWSVEIVVGAIGASHFSLFLRIITIACGWWLTALRVNSLDGRDLGEYTAAGVASGSHQQPGNGIGIRRIDPSYSLARDLAPVIVLPGGPGVVASNNGAVVVMKLCLRRLQGPPAFAIGALLANVNLHTRRMCLQNYFFIRWNFDFFRHIGRSTRLSMCQCSGADQKAGLEQFFYHAKEFNIRRLLSEFHSYRRASIGSRRAALIAGNMPLTMPTKLRIAVEASNVPESMIR